jgi:DNA polymerase-3 subunit alpha
MFVSLNNFSCFSFLEGILTPSELVQAAAACNMPYLALTDRRYLSGSLEFYTACLTAGIQPLLGLTMSVRYTHTGRPAQGSLVLIAHDIRGWSSLCRLSSALLGEPELIEQGSLPFSQLAQQAEGLLCLTGGRDSLVFPQAPGFGRQDVVPVLSRLNEIFPESLYVQLIRPTASRDTTNTARIAAARRLHLPLVYAPEVVYLNEDQARFQRIATAMRKNMPLNSLPPGVEASPGSLFPQPDRLPDFLNELPQAIENTLQIAQRCQLSLPLHELHYPALSFPDGLSPEEVLRSLARKGAEAYYSPVNEAVQARLDHELEVITQAGYASLFLIMAELLQFARQADIPTASRGSASSSLVAHCLGITTPDPLRLNLYFERFLNPARSTPPDIDTDICSVRRDLLIEHVYQQYGAQRVAMVATINRFRRRSALRETAKVFGLNSSQIGRLVNALPFRGWGPPRYSSSSEQDPFASLRLQFPAEPYPSIFEAAQFFIERPHHLSIHPGGVVISPGPIHDLVPTMLASKGIIITQFDLEGVEEMGMIKIDLLGIRGLTVLGDVADHLCQQEPGQYASRLAVLDEIPHVDEMTTALVRSGRTVGCFQIESPGMRATLREIKAENIDDLMVALALYRPGPMTGGLKDAFVRRHLGLEPVDHLHPALAPLLEDTHGVILYQEQVLRIAHELAGLSLADADLLRRAMSHFDPGQQMQTLKQRFLLGAQVRSGVPADTGERIWELMAAFAGYGFPKAHAASYAEVAWRSAWLKTHFPAHFLAAVLANWGGYYGQSAYLMEARHLGLELHPPSVNYSLREFSVVTLDGSSHLFMGLNQVRELTQRTQSRIMRMRPFVSLADFLTRVDPRLVEAENLAKAGALRDFGSEPLVLSQLRQGGRATNHLQMTLFDLQEGEKIPEPWTDRQILNAQEAVLGISVDVHPLDLVKDELVKAEVISTIEAASRRGEAVRLGGVCQSGRRAQTLARESVYLLDLQDLEGTLIVQLSKSLYRQQRSLINKHKPLIVEGRVMYDEASAEPVLNAARLWPIGD